MQIFHGSQKIVENPQFGLGNPKNDYGLGFYCTQSLDLAKEWACQQDTDGFANKYELNTDDLSILNLDSENFSILHWLSILMQNRIFSPKSPAGRTNLDFLVNKFSIDYTKYDVICGYRANDSYFSFASDFLENIIPIQALATSMKLGSLGIQIVLKSKKAFESLKFLNAEPASHTIYFPKYKARDTAARKEYLEHLRQITYSTDSIYLMDIVRKPELLDEIKL